MIIAKVVGSVVATKKDDSLISCKFMIIQPIDSNEQAVGNERVAVDYTGAGIGEIVLISQGSAVRIGENRHGKAIDLAIVGIVDEVNK